MQVHLKASLGLDFFFFFYFFQEMGNNFSEETGQYTDLKESLKNLDMCMHVICTYLLFFCSKLTSLSQLDTEKDSL